MDEENKANEVNNNEEDERRLILLTDEDGNDVTFEFLDLISYEGEEYVVLTPVDEEEDESQAVILKLIEDEDGNGETYMSFDDEELIATIYGIFKEKRADYYTFTDEDEK